MFLTLKRYLYEKFLCCFQNFLIIVSQYGLSLVLSPSVCVCVYRVCSLYVSSVARLLAGPVHVARFFFRFHCVEQRRGARKVDFLSDLDDGV